MICAPNSRYIPKGQGGVSGKSRSEVYAKYDNAGKPNCKKTFEWPSYYGDVYFGADNCLYDSKGLFSSISGTIKTRMADCDLGQNFGQQCCVNMNG